MADEQYPYRQANPYEAPPSQPSDHLRTAGTALMGWWRATTLDALCVGLMWFVGLYFIHVPWAPLWALVAAVCQFVPGIGTAFAVCGPAIAAFFASIDTDLDKLWWTLGLYAFIAIVDGALIQPLLLKRSTLVPWWAAVLGPIAGGILLPPWGALLAPPVLAVIYALRNARRSR
ncbi:AI-2E family transporter [Terriglobus sp. ADX1]|uniref:AI-2E family transporter n=1 Tax=Terriglobus sp. ADX1 TaxID=2794063 RepID=UPI002FE52096